MTQKEFRQQFWDYLESNNPELYKHGRRAKRQNEQITDIRLYFLDYLEYAYKSDRITEKQRNNFTL